MKIHHSLSILLPVLILSACAGSGEMAVQRALGIRGETPVFLGYRPVSQAEAEFRFSCPVKVRSLYLDPAVEAEALAEGSLVKILLNEPLAGGERYTADLVVEDTGGNSLNVLIPFRTRNERLPPLLITELRTEYSGSSNPPRSEFVEFRPLENGNLAALRLYIASNGMDMDSPILEFPPMEVKAGEYIVLHLRTLDTEHSRDETGPDLAASGGPEAFPDARDLWIPGSKKLLRKTDGVLFLDQNDKILDCVLLSEAAVPWTKESIGYAAELMGRQGAWLAASGTENTPESSDAVASKDSTATRSICRDERKLDTNSAADWYITASSSSTPGKPNNEKRFTR